MHFHLLFDHPLFEEQPVKDVLEPFGFLVHTNTYELPLDESDGEEFTRYKANSSTYIEQLKNTAPKGYTEIARFENEDGILIVSVLAKTFFAQSLLGSDPNYSKLINPQARAGQAIYEERTRQMQMEGFSLDQDDQWTKGELASLACSYAHHAAIVTRGIFGANEPTWLPIRLLSTMDSKWWKPSLDPRRDLIKSGALILAEIERLDRDAAKAAAHLQTLHAQAMAEGGES